MQNNISLNSYVKIVIFLIHKTDFVEIIQFLISSRIEKNYYCWIYIIMRYSKNYFETYEMKMVFYDL